MKKLLISLTLLASLVAATDSSAVTEQYDGISKEASVSDARDLINPLHRETDFS